MSDQELREVERAFQAAPSPPTARAWEALLRRVGTCTSVDQMLYVLRYFRETRVLCQYELECFEPARAIAIEEYIFHGDEPTYRSPFLTSVVAREPIEYVRHRGGTFPIRRPPEFRQTFTCMICERHIVASQRRAYPRERGDLPPEIPGRGFLVRPTYEYKHEFDSFHRSFPEASH